LGVRAAPPREAVDGFTEEITTMIWFLLAAAVLVAYVVLRRLRVRGPVTISTSEPISTMNLTKRTTEDKKAALKAANQMLR
jgi:hypothetical protein